MKDIIEKFKFKDSGVVLAAPTAIAKEFVKLGFKTNFDKQAKSTNTLIFINNNKEYLDFLKNDFKNVETDSVLDRLIKLESNKIPKNQSPQLCFHVRGFEYLLEQG
jgi:hypothetical protein